jgi:Putative DNA-binding domain
MSASYQTAFADALLNVDHVAPPGVTAHNAEIPLRRFGVYRNNFVVGLGKALERHYPVVERLVGEEFFMAMAREFVRERPPRSPLLASYGNDFADFIATFEPARDIPYLADVAKLEAARVRAYHAEDATPCGAEQFATIDASAIENIRIDLHPSTEIVRSRYPAVTIWAMNSGEREPGPIEVIGGEDAVVVRPHLDVEIRTLPPGGAAFLLALAKGLRLREAAGAGVADAGEFDLACNLAGLIGSGLARGFVVPDSKEW